MIKLERGEIEVDKDGVKFKIVLDGDYVYLKGITDTSYESNPIKLSKYRDLEALANELESRGLQVIKKQTSHEKLKSKGRDISSIISTLIDTREPFELGSQTYKWDIESAPFKKSTKMNSYLLIDTREPKELRDLVERISINQIEQTVLSIGDIHIGSHLNERLMVIERKTVTDLYNSTVSKHFHDQVERLSDFRFARGDKETKIVWIIESEQEGKRSLYNAFPETKQTDGVVNYITAIHNQHILQAYNKHHTAYLVAKLAQGFLEQELYYKVVPSRCNIEARESSNYHLYKMLLNIPGISHTTATHLLREGISIVELSKMSLLDLKKLKGVGEINAQKIYNALRYC